MGPYEILMEHKRIIIISSISNLIFSMGIKRLQQLIGTILTVFKINREVFCEHEDLFFDRNFRR